MPIPDTLTIQQRQIVNKRLTLNLLIQGAATHAHWSAHRLVASELDTLDRRLVTIYDEMMLRSRLGYWVGGIPSIMGNPIKFWWRMMEGGHEFAYHPFLVKHGYRIAVETQRDVKRRCKKANLAFDGHINEVHGFPLFNRAIGLEIPHLEPLEELAKDVCCDAYGIDRNILDAKLTQTPRFGTIREPETHEGQILLGYMVGWSAVVRRNGKLNVKATAAFWPMLVHELVKGSVELICLHGMNHVSEHDFKLVLERTDHIEFEIPMLQIGGTIFHRLLLARPREIPLPEAIMHVAKLEPLQLEQFMMHLFESPNRATAMVRSAAASS